MNTETESSKTKKRRASAYLAWALFVIIAIFSLLSVSRTALDRPPDDNLIKLAGDLLWGFFPIVFAFLAALIISRRPRNIIGWLMMLPASLVVIDFIGRTYLQQFPTAPADPSLMVLLMVYIANILWVFLIFLLLFTMQLFPNGRPLSPRWRWIFWSGLVMMALFMLMVAGSPTLALTESVDWTITNPIGFLPADQELIFLFWTVAMILIALLSAAAPFVRYRRSTGVEREQIKWLFYAGGIFFIFWLPGAFTTESQAAWSFIDLLFSVALLALPVAITIAILRYRLYDIDVIIRRTLVYGALTVVLVTIYLISILLLQAIFSAVSGQQSPVAIVISTLIIAALFNRVRRRVQAVIDRRFFRRKYDATHTLEQFALTARDEVNLEQLTAELVQVVQETMQPERVMLWLKEDKE